MLALVLLLPAPQVLAEVGELPSLGLTSALEISVHQERLLGQGWLRQFRAQTRLYQDPLVQDYTERLLQRLATYNTGLEQKELDLVLVNQRQLNAFAVPGGVVGINTGLFLFAAYEDEFASVAAHELAHISQRHFARRVEASRGAQWTAMAGILAGILVASQGHADAGVAAIAGTQAAAIQSQLAWSRSYEQEADRIGMETLVAAGYSPEAMPRMFAQMQRVASLSGRPPEFLLTHPLTESRIADAQARADQMSGKRAPIRGKDYEMIRTRIIFNQIGSADDAWTLFSRQQASPAAEIYAQALRARGENQPERALELLQQLVKEEPEWLLVQYLVAEELVRQKQWQAAAAQLDELALYAPGYYPALFLRGEMHMQLQQWDQARRIFQQLSQQRPGDPDVWFQLAEAAGKSDRQVQLHQARAEYFQLTGRFRQASSQLDLAVEQARLQDQPWGVQAAIRERRRELEQQRSLMEF
ncbi:Putative Zn-dependent protease, contains TPR repeats [Marinospirillum alkaliphilum DSM 21637]|uniref:Putative beta-barrel assembly-enhancing protease n=2 Tax=Marinospirillum TaxID=64968 RepID=A0A1K1W1L0_9GAMM|nr:Putative Zn-dependent protease, contains TPR repeats [Marinospirillum alkaliphilum DSM 21637]